MYVLELDLIRIVSGGYETNVFKIWYTKVRNSKLFAALVFWENLAIKVNFSELIVVTKRYEIAFDCIFRNLICKLRFKMSIRHGTHGWINSICNLLKMNEESLYSVKVRSYLQNKTFWELVQISWREHMRGKGVAQMTTTLNNRYQVKVST